MPLINIFSIAWSDETFRVASESGYQVLDNRSNDRPDWYELWPIRKYFIDNGLKKNEYYGFFSTKFKNKTGLNSKEVFDFVNNAINLNADVITFSPQPDQSAAFINVFEHANFYFPGFKEMASEFLETLQIKVDLNTLIMDSRTTVFSNYFVANSDFWNHWLTINEQLFQTAENSTTSLGKELNVSTNYGNGVQKKVFLQEEVASLLLTLYSENYKCVPANLWKMGWGQMGFENFKYEMIISDALKMAMRDTSFNEYLEAYNLIREKLKREVKL